MEIIFRKSRGCDRRIDGIRTPFIPRVEMSPLYMRLFGNMQIRRTESTPSMTVTQRLVRATDKPFPRSKDCYPPNSTRKYPYREFPDVP